MCHIGGDCFRKDESNPENVCEFCDPAKDQEGWTAGVSIHTHFNAS